MGLSEFRDAVEIHDVLGSVIVTIVFTSYLEKLVIDQNAFQIRVQRKKYTNLKKILKKGKYF